MELTTLKDGKFVNVYASPKDKVMSLFKCVMYEDIENGVTRSKYDTIVDAVRKVSHNETEKVVIQGYECLPWGDAFYH